MEIVTFTGTKGITQEREDYIEKCFPEKKPRSYKFEKPTIFITSRVHPGETPASFVLEGMLDFLCEDTLQTKTLLDNFVFKIIPILNPDGVYRGYYRLDTLANNLNRFYTDPDPILHPTIYAAKRAILQQFEYNKLGVYVDLHAHASKRGCFMFGNSLKGEEMLQNVLLPKLISLNSLNFDFLECCFADYMMNVVDEKDGLSREGCGRVAIMKATNGHPNCYTLECNYASGRTINRLSNKIDKATGQVESENTITNPNSKIYVDAQAKDPKKTKAPVYNIEIFQDIGRAFLIGLLDYYQINPVSRLPSSQYKNTQGVRQDLMSKFPTFVAKRESESGHFRLKQTAIVNEPKKFTIKTRIHSINGAVNQQSTVNLPFKEETALRPTLRPPLPQKLQLNPINTKIQHRPEISSTQKIKGQQEVIQKLKEDIAATQKVKEEIVAVGRAKKKKKGRRQVLLPQDLLQKQYSIEQIQKQQFELPDILQSKNDYFQTANSIKKTNTLIDKDIKCKSPNVNSKSFLPYIDSSIYRTRTSLKNRTDQGEI